jgi:esterase/lipase superfamily enzyme
VSACLPPGTDQSVARCTPVTVYFATDRQPGAPKSASVATYTGNRSNPDGLSYGTAIVTIPKFHSLGVLEDLAWYEFSADAEKHVIVQRVAAQTEGAFYDSLKRRYSDKDAIVYLSTGTTRPLISRSGGLRKSRSTSSSLARQSCTVGHRKALPLP